MKTSPSWGSFTKSLQKRSRKFFEDSGRVTTVTGIVLAPRHVDGTESLLKNIPSWHRRSANSFDFYWPGHNFSKEKQLVAEEYIRDPESLDGVRHHMMPIYVPPKYRRVEIDNFSESSFLEFVDDLQWQVSSSKAKLTHVPKSKLTGDNVHSGEIDFILLDTEYNASDRACRLRWDTAVVMHMSQLERLSSLITANSFFASMKAELTKQVQIDQSTHQLYDTLGLGNLGIARTQAALTLAAAIGGLAGGAVAVIELFQMLGPRVP